MLCIKESEKGQEGQWPYRKDFSLDTEGEMGRRAFSRDPHPRGPRKKGGLEEVSGEYPPKEEGAKRESPRGLTQYSFIQEVTSNANAERVGEGPVSKRLNIRLRQAEKEGVSE